jgi:hypothetical protein
MANRWLNDGRPGADGRLCLIVDPEDGTRPSRFWGKTQDEVLAKVAKSFEHGQRYITAMKAAAPPPSDSSKPPTNGTTNPQESRPHRLTADEQLAATADLSHPSKAPAAVVRLLEHETGLDFDAMRQKETIERIAKVQMAWEDKHPEFPRHPTNYTLLTNTAALRVGYENITELVMDAVYNELLAAGTLVPAADTDEEPPPPNPPVPPDEHPATSTTVRPRRAGSYSSRDLRATAPPPASKTPAYTRAQVAAMSSAELQRKMETEPGFADLVAEYSTGTTTRANA